MIKVLVAEDNNILRKNIINKLNAEQDIEVIAEAASGKEAFEKASAFDIDVVVMDMEMESINAGITYAGKIIVNKPGINILILTVHEEEDLIIHSFTEGVVDYVIKDSSCRNLIEHIRNIMNDEISFDPLVGKAIKNDLKKMKKERKEIDSLYRISIQLTSSEREVLRLLYQGYKTKEIARLRFVEMITVKKQITGIIKKFNVKRTSEVIALIKDHNAESLFFAIE